MSRFGFLLAVAALGVAAYVAAGLGPAARRTRDRSEVPGVVVLCLDTLRADVVDVGADHRGLPSLRAFAGSATRFDGAIAPSSGTAPSVATLLTGLEPGAHGVLDPTFRSRLPASIPTIATILRAEGWSTAACTAGGWVDRGSGLEDGFDQFAADFDASAPRDVVERWRSRRPLDRPFFLFLHTYAAHDPYGDKTKMATGACTPDDEVRGREVADAVRAASATGDDDLKRRFLRLRMTDPCGSRVAEQVLGAPTFLAAWATCRDVLDGAWHDEPRGRAEAAYLRAAYLAALPYVDDRLAATLAALGTLPRDTVIVVCSDHGEAFGEHRVLYHGRYVHPELTRALLLVRARGLPSGARFAATCGLADVVPTILELAGVRAAARFDGRSLVAFPGRPDVGRPVSSLVTAPEDGSGTDEPWVRRAAVRDDRVTWAGTYDRRANRWTEEAWFDRRLDPEEHRPLTSSPGATDEPAFEAERARVRRAIELFTR